MHALLRRPSGFVQSGIARRTRLLSEYATSTTARRIVRFRDNASGAVHLALQPLGPGDSGHRGKGGAKVLSGDLLVPGSLYETGETVDINASRYQLLAPVDPPIILGTGLNYK